MAKKSTKLQALQDIFEENGILAEMIEIWISLKEPHKILIYDYQTGE